MGGNRWPMLKEMNLIPVGISIIIIGIAVVAIGALLHAFGGQQPSKGEAKYSFVGFIGPFPFGFGNNQQLLMTAFIIAIVFSLALTFLFSRGMR